VHDRDGAHGGGDVGGWWVARGDIGDGGGGRTWTVIVVVELGGYDHGGVLELDTIVVVVSGGRGRMEKMGRKGLVVLVVIMAMKRMVVVVTMHVLGRVLWIVLCGHERRMGVLLLLLLLMEKLLLVLVLVLVLGVVVLLLLVLLVWVWVLLLLGRILGMLRVLGLLRLLGVILMELVVVLVLVLVLVGERGAVVDVVFLVGGRVRLAAIKAWMVLMVVVVLGVETEGLGRGGGVRGGCSS
jgi:hypothetical protein